MAKKAKGNRVQVILECTEQKASGVPGMSRYITTKNRKYTTERIMAKKVVATLQKGEGRTYSKVIKMVKSPKTGAYVFKEEMVPNDQVQETLKK